jgi:hypothetical protein
MNSPSVERTLLPTSILDTVMASKVENRRQLETPRLATRYQPAAWPSC